MIGQRSLPATVGGVERHVEEVVTRLAQRGHEVTAFVRAEQGTPSRVSTYREVIVRQQRSIPTKHLEALSHSVVSSLVARRHDFDVVHFHSVGPGLAAPLLRIGGRARVVLTVHGLDDQRAKWSRPARGAFRLVRRASARAPDFIVTDAAWMAEAYAGRGVPVRHVRNGVTPRLAQLDPDRCVEGPPIVLFVGRLVPEKRADDLVRAFAAVPGEARLVIVGGPAYTNRFAARVHDLAARDPRIEVLGAVHGAALDTWWARASVFCLPSTVEGLPLVLLDAAASGVPIVASDIAAHREVLGRSQLGQLLVPVNDRPELSKALAATLHDLAGARAAVHHLRERVLREYSWDATVDALESIYADLVFGADVANRSRVDRATTM